MDATTAVSYVIATGTIVLSIGVIAFIIAASA
jgi:hypothetical protein